MDLLFQPPLGVDHNGAPQMRRRIKAEDDPFAARIAMAMAGVHPSTAAAAAIERGGGDMGMGLGTAPLTVEQQRAKDLAAKEDREEDLRHLLRFLSVAVSLVLMLFLLISYINPMGGVWDPEGGEHDPDEVN